MIKISNIKSVNDKEVQVITNRDFAPSAKISSLVRTILKRVQKEGHQAVMDYARKYDGLKGSLAVTAAQISASAQKCDPLVKKAIKASVVNVRAFHIKQCESSWRHKAGQGVVLGQQIRALGRVGVYVPGGSGTYPSSVIMAAVPAQVAGVEQIAVVTPVGRALNPAVAFALKELNISEVYKVGGAQAVGMLAFGTRMVKRVDKIVGPANIYAALAKKEVFGQVDIDMIAGPSEVLVMADETSDPDWVAADMLSQAEHGSGYEAAVCITTSPEMAIFVRECIKVQVDSSPKKQILAKALKKYGKIFVVKDWQTGCELANIIAPEHLELMMANAESMVKNIKNAGAIFVGPYSSEPVGDYFAGPNHVLPTNGSARFFSPLGVYDFIKRTSYIHYSRQALIKNGSQIAALALAEGFYHHAAAINKRL